MKKQTKRNTVIVYDESSHRYRIPCEMEEKFNSILDRIYESKSFSEEFYDACEELNDKFSEFRVDGL